MSTSDSSRRQFLKSSAVGGALGAVALPAIGSGVHIAHREELRVGIVGCGGRGTGAVSQALRADPQTRLVAMGDAFPDRIQRSLKGLAGAKDIADRVDVPQERQFVGFDAYAKVMEADLDVVVLASPPHFRPKHLAHAIDKGIHAFAEKPVAVDAPGVRSVMETCEKARKNKLAVVSGLCYRYHDGRRAIMDRIHNGALGDIVAMNANYITGALWHHDRKPEWSDMEWQVRNWLYFTWLSGDHIAEQHIHSLDVMAWAMQDEYPESAVSEGGRQTRIQPMYGHVFDHFATIYEWKNGTKGFSFCRQQAGCFREVNDFIYGSQGRANVFKHRIDGNNEWRFKGKPRNMYQNEHDELFRSIRAGDPINNGDYMCKSTLMAIMGRMAAYTGQKITWEQALGSQEKLGPDSYEWGDIETPPVAMPGTTKFV